MFFCLFLANERILSVLKNSAMWRKYILSISFLLFLPIESLFCYNVFVFNYLLCSMYKKKVEMFWSRAWQCTCIYYIIFAQATKLATPVIDCNSVPYISNLLHLFCLSSITMFTREAIVIK